MYAGMDATGVDTAPVRTDWSAASLFFIAWMLVGTFIALNLFIGAIVDSFSAIRAESDGLVLLTPAQKQWMTVMRESRELRPSVVPRPPNNWFVACRLPFYALVVRFEQRFEDLLLVAIVANIVVMACDYEGIESDDPAFYAWYISANDFFRTLYFTEFGIKIVALGVCGYLSSMARQFEFVLILATLLEMYATHIHG